MNKSFLSGLSAILSEPLSELKSLLMQLAQPGIDLVQKIKVMRTGRINSMAFLAEEAIREAEANSAPSVLAFFDRKDLNILSAQIACLEIEVEKYWCLADAADEAGLHGKGDFFGQQAILAEEQLEYGRNLIKKLSK